MTAMKLSHFLFLEIAIINDDCDEVVHFLFLGIVIVDDDCNEVFSILIFRNRDCR
jgi:hypothetical protein